jgi:hypothetical protein
MLPPLAYAFAILYLTSALVSALVILADLTLYPQKKWIMSWVWPLTALYLGPWALAFYYLYGRNKPSMGRWLRRTQTPFWAKVFKSALHGGAGCAVGAFFAAWLAYVLALSLVPKFLLAFVCAFTFGLCFHYVAIARTRKQNRKQSLASAIKSDAFSLIAFEVGMFFWIGVTAVAYPDLDPATWDYWFMMQIAMLLGLFTTYPVNWLLITRGVKNAI